MEKPLDKVNFAFNGFYGDNMTNSTRKRIYWIINNVMGNNILDIGCSQGITSILLGREGKKVIGIDSLSESIEIANSELLKEEESIRKNIRFICDDVINSTEIDKDSIFSTIILGEILEHFGDSKSLLEKAYKLGNEATTYIITVPFGINDYFDHKKTYYYYNFHKEISEYFNINNVTFMGKWVGVVAKKKKILNDIENEFDISIIPELEKNFYQIERHLLEENKKIKEQLKISNNYLYKLRELINNNTNAINNINKNIEVLIKLIKEEK